MKIFLTGATGFIGSTLLRHSLRAGHEVMVYSRRKLSWPPGQGIKAVQGSFENIPLLMQSLRDFKPDWIYHCAGSGSVPFSMEHPLEDFQSSVSLVQSLLEAHRTSSSKARIALMSSAALYGNPSTLPINEDAQLAPLSPYGFHRKIAEEIFHSYAQSFGLEGFICRIFSAYGQGLQKQVVYEIFKKFMDPTNLAPEFWGTGAETRDFIHADDLARAVLHLSLDEARGIYNLASGTQTSIRSLVELISTSMGAPKPYSFNGMNRPGDPLYWQADTSKLLHHGFKTEISLESGIQQIWESLQKTSHYTPSPWSSSCLIS